MDLRECFGSRHGIGMLASADAEGAVDAAVRSRPHVFDDGSVAFVMREPPTHRNVGEDPPRLPLHRRRRVGAGVSAALPPPAEPAL